MLKKKYYLSNKKKVIHLNVLDTRNKSIALNMQFKFLNTSCNKTVAKSKFFQSMKTSIDSYGFINNKLPLFNSKVNNQNKINNGSFTISKNLNYVDLNVSNTQTCKLNLIYKEIMSILFILNLVKLFQVYKTILNLVYLNIKI